MSDSKSVNIVRSLRRVIEPVGIRCVLCKLYPDNDDDGVEQFEVRYNGDGGMPENPLCALTRRKYICDACIDALAGDEEE